MESQIELLQKISGQLGELIELQKKRPLVHFEVGVGDIWTLLNAPADGFSDEFRKEMEQFAITHFKARKKEVKNDPANSNEYKGKKEISLTPIAEA